MNNQVWGENPQTQAKKRDVPYIRFNDSEICLFLPLPNINYHLSLPLINGWQDPVEIWTHDVYNQGRFVLNVFCKNVDFNTQICPFCKANNIKQQNIGRTLENKERPFPLKKKYAFPILVDEVPEKPFLLYKISEKFMEQIKNQFKMAKRSDIKVVILRTGSGRNDTQYSVSGTNLPVNERAFETAKIPAVTKENYKKFLTSLEDFNKLDFINVNAITTETAQPVASAQAQPIDQPGATQAPLEVKTHAFVGDPAELEKAKNFVIDFGPFADQKLGSLDKATLIRIAATLNGDVQKYAKMLIA